MIQKLLWSIQILWTMLTKYYGKYYDNINGYNPNGSRKILIVFDDMIADMNTNKKFQSIV